MARVPEFSDARVLGALRIVDAATGATLRRRLTFTSDEATLVRNRSQLYVIRAARGLEHHLTAHAAPPANPAIGSVSVTLHIQDPTRQYLPRAVTLGLPRNPDPANAGQPDSLFQPVDVQLFASAAVRPQRNWSLVRGSLTAGDGEPVAGALVVVRDARSAALLGRGVSDDNGEVLVVVPGVPITRFADGEPVGPPDGVPPAVVETTTPAIAELSIASPRSWPVDPDQLEAAHPGQVVDSQSITLRTGHTERVTFQIP